MRQISVEQIVRLVLPTGTRVVSGRGGLHGVVSWAAMLKSSAPAFGRLGGRELALVDTATMRLLDEDLLLTQVLQSLAERNTAALAVMGDIPSTAVSLADELQLPLLALPPGTDIIRLQREIIALLVDNDGQFQQLVGARTQQLLLLSLQGASFTQLLQTAADFSGRAVILEDQRSTLRASALPVNTYAIQSLTLEKVTEIWQQSTRPRFPFARRPGIAGSISSVSSTGQGSTAQAALNMTAKTTTEHSPAAIPALIPLSLPGLSRLIVPILIKGAVSGYISFIAETAYLDPFDNELLIQLATICATDLAQEQVRTATENRLRGHFFDELISGLPWDEAEMLERAERDGYNLTQFHVVFMLQCDSDTDQAVKIFLRSGEAELSSWAGALVRIKEEHLLVFIPVNGDATDLAPLKKQIERVRCRLVAMLKLGVSVGLGRAYQGSAGVAQSFHESEQALQAGRTLFGPNRLTSFDSLGVYRLLFPISISEESAEFTEELLGKLIDYDRSSDGELLKTLEVFFACHGNQSLTAKTLYLHRTSLVYRLDRIREVTGYDLDDPEVRLSLQVALKLHRTMQIQQNQQNLLISVPPAQVDVFSGSPAPLASS